MGVLIGIDFGKKRTGLAHTDSGQIIASGLTTVATQNAFSFLVIIKKKPRLKSLLLDNPNRKTVTNLR